MSRHRCQRPLEDVDDQLREEVQLVEAGVTWAEQDTHPWELFIYRLHEMFLAEGAQAEGGRVGPHVSDAFPEGA